MPTSLTRTNSGHARIPPPRAPRERRTPLQVRQRERRASVRILRIRPRLGPTRRVLQPVRRIRREQPQVPPRALRVPPASCAPRERRTLLQVRRRVQRVAPALRELLAPQARPPLGIPLPRAAVGIKRKSASFARTKATTATTANARTKTITA